ncbi:MAG: SatD family protein, partial [Cyclobacteriaceae bacterium]|nr:SatD family protein [Cyclobacteriaceae bacterium]
MKTIIMADVVGSSKQKANALMKTFRKLTDEVNQDAKQYIVSPLTVTLGDEFQGIVTDLTGAVNILIMFEEKIIRSGQDIKLRYVIHQGEIATPVNIHNAHGMLGKGLTD